MATGVCIGRRAHAVFVCDKPPNRLWDHVKSPHTTVRLLPRDRLLNAVVQYLPYVVKSWWAGM